MTKTPKSRAGRSGEARPAPEGRTDAAASATAASPVPNTVIVTDVARPKTDAAPAAVAPAPAEAPEAPGAPAAAPTETAAPSPASSTDPRRTTPGIAARGAPASPEASPNPAPAPSARTSEPARNGSGGSGAIAAAILAALLVGGALVAYDAFFRGPAGVPAPVEERIAAAEARIAQAESRAQQAEARAEEAESAATEASARVEALPPPPEIPEIPEIPQDPAPVLSALDERLAALENAFGQAMGEEVGQRISAAMERAYSELGQAIETARGAAATAGSAADDARSAAAAAQAQADDALAAARAALTEVDAVSGARDAAIGELRAAIEREERGTRAIIAAGLSANEVLVALPAGAPYAQSLAALEASGAPQEPIEALRPFAETGAPTAYALSREWAEIMPQLRRGEAPGEPQEGVTGFLQGVFSRAVTVEPAEELDRPTGPARDHYATVGQALARGDIPAALAAWRDLPEQSRTRASDFGARLEARVAAEEAARTIAGAARAALLSPQESQ